MKEAQDALPTLPRRDRVVVVTVSALLVALIVLWMTQAASAPSSAAADLTPAVPLLPGAEDPAVPTTFVLAGEER
jgi:hypothetical protein